MYLKKIIIPPPQIKFAPRSLIFQPQLQNFAKHIEAELNNHYAYK